MMMEPQFPDAPSQDDGQRGAQGIVWYYGHGMLGHSGGDPGAIEFRTNADFGPK